MRIVMKVSTKIEVDTTIRCLVIALLLRYVTLWPWPLPFWPWSVVIHGGSRGQPFHQVWRSYGYLSWVMSSDISHRIPLTMRLCSHVLRMRPITWPMRRGKIFPTYLKSLTPISLFTIQLLWHYGTRITTNSVMSQNSVWPCGKDHTAFCACAKSRQRSTLP